MTEARFTLLPRIRVLMDDDTVHDVQALNIDLVMFDRERARHRDWPSSEEGGAFYQSWIAWHALTRLGKVPKMNFFEFCERALEVAPAKQAEDDGDQDGQEDGEEPVDPTRTGPAPG
jgi:hypothetical protein